jgi:hypothetical protein
MNHATQVDHAASAIAAVLKMALLELGIPVDAHSMMLWSNAFAQEYMNHKPDEIQPPEVFIERACRFVESRGAHQAAARCRAQLETDA